MSSLEIREFFGEGIPTYAILSHTWGTDEVTFEDIVEDESVAQLKKGFGKLQGFCCKAREVGFEWVWMDTCCIDKRSSSELSEAINSMFAWYRNAMVCYVYLEDLNYSIEPMKLVQDCFPSALKTALKKCRWFTRGWTLQELLAPEHVEFYTKSWASFGTKLDLALELSSITHIDQAAIATGDLSIYNAAQKMSWAAARLTTRKEDIAYCLLGIFEVNMPLLYGEGQRAFYRLQEEIMKTSEDYSLLLCGLLDFDYLRKGKAIPGSPVADGPHAFKVCHNQVLNPANLSYGDVQSLIKELPKLCEDFAGTPPKLMTYGLKIQAPALRKVIGPAGDLEGLLVRLPLCVTSRLAQSLCEHRSKHKFSYTTQYDQLDPLASDQKRHLCLWLQKGSGERYVRVPGDDIAFFDSAQYDFTKFESRSVLIEHADSSRRLSRSLPRTPVSFRILDVQGRLRQPADLNWIVPDLSGDLVHLVRLCTTENTLFFAAFQTDWCSMVSVEDATLKDKARLAIPALTPDPTSSQRWFGFWTSILSELERTQEFRDAKSKKLQMSAIRLKPAAATAILSIRQTPTAPLVTLDISDNSLTSPNLLITDSSLRVYIASSPLILSGTRPGHRNCY